MNFNNNNNEPSTSSGIVGNGRFSEMSEINHPIMELFRNWSIKYQPRPQLPPHPENQENPGDQPLPLYPIREPQITVLPNDPGSEKFYQPHFDMRQLKNQLIDLDRIFPAIESPDTSSIIDQNDLTEPQENGDDSSSLSDQNQDLSPEAANQKIKDLENLVNKLRKKNNKLKDEMVQIKEEKKCQNITLARANVEIDKWQSICRDRQTQINIIYRHREIDLIKMTEMNRQYMALHNTLTQERKTSYELKDTILANEKIISELLNGIETGQFVPKDDHNQMIDLLKKSYADLLVTCEEQQDKIVNLRSDVHRLELQNLRKHY